MAYAFDIASFGEKENSVATSGSPTVSADYPDSYLLTQPHPYLFGQNVDPATYEEDSEYENFAYFEPHDDYRKYLDYIRYKTLVADMGGTIRYALAECDEFLDLNPLLSPGVTEITSAKTTLELALVDIQGGDISAAKLKLKQACDLIGAVPTLYDELNVMAIRVALGNHWRTGNRGIILTVESYPRTHDYDAIDFNLWGTWQVKYGMDFANHPCVTNDFSWFGRNPTQDLQTYAKDPTRLEDYSGQAFTPTVLMDHRGNLYDPATTNYSWIWGMSMYDIDRGGHYFMINTPQGSDMQNELPDYAEKSALSSWRHIELIGGRDNGEQIKPWDYLRCINMIYDTYDDVVIRYSSQYKTNAFEDTVMRIIDSGVQNLILMTLFSNWSTYSHYGILNWIPDIIAQSSNPSVNFFYDNSWDALFGHYESYFEGHIDNSLQQEIDRASGKLGIFVISHGFPTIDRDYTENTSPWIWYSDPCGYLGREEPCLFMGLPAEPCMPEGWKGYPTGWVYGEDQIHWDMAHQFEEFKWRIEDRVAQNPNITDLRVYPVYNMFAQNMPSRFDPRGKYDTDFPLPGDSHGWGNALSTNEAYMAAKEEGVEYIIDWLFYWPTDGRDTLDGHRRMMNMPDNSHDIPAIPGSGSWPHDRQDYAFWDENYRTEFTTSDGIQYIITKTGISGAETDWPKVLAMHQQAEYLLQLAVCEGDFNCDGNVDATDVTSFLGDFGRNQFINPCTNGSPCNGDFNCDSNVDAADVTKFLEDFGRNQFNNPCPVCVVGNWCSY
jgi:hypothetical protein